jgi:hypothetical protein
MPEVWFEPRYAIRAVHNPDLDWLRHLILDPFRPGREFGEATVTFQDGDHAIGLILIADRDLGYYLNYGSPGDTWLSLGDPSRLAEVVCPDDWQASAGLFVRPDRAWLAVTEFCRSGLRSSKIEWIRPEDLPPQGNW